MHVYSGLSDIISGNGQLFRISLLTIHLTVYIKMYWFYRVIVVVCLPLQEPDLLLLDEPTNHLDLDTIEWLEGYLNRQDVPMVIISHDRAFLDQLCTKIVETDMGVSRTFEGN